MVIATLFYLAIILALVRYAIYKAQRRRLEKLIDKFPGPKTIPLLGNLNMCFGTSEDHHTPRVLVKPPYTVVLKRACDVLYHMKSPTRLWLGPIPVVLIRDPENFQIVCNEMLVKANEYKFMKDLLGEGLLTANGEKWKQKRRSLNPAFNINLMNVHFLNIFNKFNAKLIKTLDSIADSGQEVDLWDYILKCTRDTICVTAMGYQDEETADESKERSNVLKYSSVLETASTLVTERIFKPWLHPYPFFKFYKFIMGYNEVFEKAFELPLQIICKKRQESNNNNNSKPQSVDADKAKDERNRKNFINILLKSDVFKDLPEYELAEEVVTFIMGGSESSAITVCFTLLMLGKYPKFQERVYEELMTVFEGDCNRPVELNDLNHLPYMEQCIKETLRRFHPVPVVVRQSEKDIVLANGEILPAGARVLLAIIGVHLNKELFNEPFTWQPDRFSLEEIQKRHPCSFVPFGMGPRSCIGTKYAMFTIKTQLATILRKYKFSTNLRLRDIELGFDLVLRNKTGYKAFIMRRDQHSK